MLEKAVKEYLDYLNKSDQEKKNLFDEPDKVSLQFNFSKIPNLINEKKIICKLPHSININATKEDPQICLFVKDIDPKDRDYDKTIRKYQKIIDKEGLNRWITLIIPLKQLNLEFRHHEAKRKLSTSFDMFLADKCLHDILFSGSKLGKEFRKRKRMPFDVDLTDPNLKETILNIMNSTTIRLTGKGPTVDVNTFLSSHSTEQAIENINKVKSELIKHLPGGEANIKSIFLKSTDKIAIPIYQNENLNTINEVKVENNMTPSKKKKAKKLSIKRLQKKALVNAKKKKRALKTQIKKNDLSPTAIAPKTEKVKKTIEKSKPTQVILSNKKAVTKKSIKKSAFIK